MMYTPPTSQDLLEMAIKANQKAHQLLNPWDLSASAELPDVFLPILLIFLLPTMLYMTSSSLTSLLNIFLVFCKAKIKCSFALLLFELHYYLLSY